VPVKSVIDVEVNDKAFQDFYDVFKRFRDDVAELPKLWANAFDAIKPMREFVGNMSDETEKHIVEVSKMTTVHEKITREIEKTDRSMIKLGRSTKGVLDNVIGISSSMLKWGTAFAGLGSLSSYFTVSAFEMMANKASTQQIQAGGIGVPASQLQGYKNVYEPILGDIMSPLNVLSRASSDVVARTMLSSYLGINQQDIQSKTATENLPALLSGVRGFMKNPNYAGQQALLWDQFQLSQYTGLSYNQARIIGNYTPDQLSEFSQKAQKSAQAQAPIDEVNARFQELNTNLREINSQFDAKAKASLITMGPDIVSISDSFHKLFAEALGSQAVQDGVHAFAKFMKDPMVHKALEDLGGLLASLTSHLFSVLEWVVGHDPSLSIEEKEHRLALISGASAVGGTVGAALGGGVLGAAVGAAIAGTATAVTLDASNYNAKNGLVYVGEGQFIDINKDYSISLPAVISKMLGIESGGNPRAVSPKGASGLLQIMPGTYRDMRRKHPDLGPDIFDKIDNPKAAGYYLSELYGTFNGDWRKAIAAYNAGPHRVQRAIEKSSWTHKDWLQYLPEETISYVGKVFGPNNSDIRMSPNMTLRMQFVSPTGYDWNAIASSLPFSGTE
jgi:hypothetical protein